jgi:hypothetical protein
MTRPTRRRLLTASLTVGVVTLGLLICGCSDPIGVAAGPATRAAASSSPPVSPPAETASPPIESSAPTAKAPVSRGARAKARRRALDRLAGVRTSTVAWKGTGKLVAVPGKSAGPGKGKVYTIKIEVEKGLDVDRVAFAEYVMATLNDKRSWTEKGRRRFARTGGTPDLQVVLASPETSAALCRPLRTGGKLSCREGNRAVLTMYRWVKAIPEYAGNHDGYRHYVINHEVGHALGHGHEYCAGKGRMAPVMMQQTKGLKGCTPNPWPHP